MRDDKGKWREQLGDIKHIQSCSVLCAWNVGSGGENMLSYLTDANKYYQEVGKERVRTTATQRSIGQTRDDE